MPSQSYKAKKASERNWRKLQLSGALAGMQNAKNQVSSCESRTYLECAMLYLEKAINAEYGPKVCPKCKKPLKVLSSYCNNVSCLEAME